MNQELRNESDTWQRFAILVCFIVWIPALLIIPFLHTGGILASALVDEQPSRVSVILDWLILSPVACFCIPNAIKAYRKHAKARMLWLIASIPILVLVNDFFIVLLTISLTKIFGRSELNYQIVVVCTAVLWLIYLVKSIQPKSEAEFN
jgi:drug/metabolite transporter superfamily protein YnfA